MASAGILSLPRISPGLIRGYHKVETNHGLSSMTHGLLSVNFDDPCKMSRTMVFLCKKVYARKIVKNSLYVAPKKFRTELIWVDIMG